MSFLSEEWIAAAAAKAAKDLGSQVGLAGPEMGVCVGFLVVGGPNGDVRYQVRVGQEGVEVSGSDSDRKPDVTLTIPYNEAESIASGHLSPTDAFHRGQVSVSGSAGKLIESFQFFSNTESPFGSVPA